jgi:hypothetical protein
MIASAVGGAYGYSILDGKMAVKDAEKVIDRIDLSEYDVEEASEMQGYIDQARKDLETAKTRKEVYEVIDDFKTSSSKVKTKTQKELEEARRQVEEARNYNNNNNNNNNTDNSSNNNYGYGTDTGTTADGDNNYNNNELNNSGAENEQKESNGILNSLFGSNDDNADDTDNY